MTEPVLMHGHDSEGRLRAAPLPHDHRPEMARLARFLTEEVHWPHYVDLLLEHAAQAATVQTGPVTATGNAYAVTFDGRHASIEHLHLPGQMRSILPINLFVHALKQWRRHLDGE